MKNTNDLSNLTKDEARYQVLLKKWVLPNSDSTTGIISFDVFKKIIFADPTTIVPQNFDEFTSSNQIMENVKVGKYTKWMIYKFVKPIVKNENTGEIYEPNTDEYDRLVGEVRRLFLEDLPRFKKLLLKYERFKVNLVDCEKKNIDKVKSFDELSNLLVKVGSDTVELELYRGKKVKKENGVETKTNFQFPGSEILQVGEHYTLIKISDKGDLGSKAASYFGGYHNVDKGESSWCTSTKDSYNSNSYRQDGPLYIIMANNNKGKVGSVTGLPQERYQIHFPSNQYRDRRNQDFPIAEMLNGDMSDLKQHFKEEFANGLVTRNGDTVDVSYPDDAAGKFIGIYGFSEFFESLPTTIKKLLVTNKSTENIDLVIPDSISRFTDLEYLMFTNCVKKLSDKVGELKKLKFIGLTKNQNLVGLPECLVDLVGNDLSFINLQGSNPKMLIPKSLSEKMDENEPGFYFLD